MTETKIRLTVVIAQPSGLGPLQGETVNKTLSLKGTTCQFKGAIDMKMTLCKVPTVGGPASDSDLSPTICL